MLFLVVGAYIAYMGVQMYQNTVSGLSSMSMTTTIILMSAMIAAGVGVIIYGANLFKKGYAEQKQTFNELEQEDKNEEEDK